MEKHERLRWNNEKAFATTRRQPSGGICITVTNAVVGNATTA